MGTFPAGEHSNVEIFCSIFIGGKGMKFDLICPLELRSWVPRFICQFASLSVLRRESRNKDQIIAN